MKYMTYLEWERAIANGETWDEIEPEVTDEPSPEAERKLRQRESGILDADYESVEPDEWSW